MSTDASNQLLYPNSRQYLADCLWAIRPNTLDVMCEVLQQRANGVDLTADEIKARIGAPRARTGSQMSGRVAVLPLSGVIDQKVNAMSEISGGTSVNEFMSYFREAMADNSVSAIVLDVDSPGGSVSGIMEAANEIYSMRGKKPIVAVADPMIASAAYWLACAADEVVCMPSGMVGSIGVVAVHTDISAMNATAGVKPTYITYGAFKAEGNRDTPLTDDAKAYKQTQVDAMGDLFTRFVAKARGVGVDSVRSDFGQGRMLMAKDALAAKMIDSIGTLDQTIARLSRPRAAAAQSVSAQELYSANYELVKSMSAIVADATLDEEALEASIKKASEEFSAIVHASVTSARAADPEERDMNALLDLYGDPTANQVSPQGLMSDTKHAADAVLQCANRWAERKTLREKTKGQTSTEVFTKSNLDAMKSADAAIGGLIGTLEDAKSSLAAMDSTSIPVPAEEAATEPVLSDAQHAVAEYELIRARSYGVRV